MKNLLNEEINQIKYLLNYNRGLTLLEQKNIINEDSAPGGLGGKWNSSTGEYTIAKGDTLSKIGKAFGVKWMDIWEENKDTLRSGKPNCGKYCGYNWIFVGEVVTIPGKAETTTTIDNTATTDNTATNTSVDDPVTTNTQEGQGGIDCNDPQTFFRTKPSDFESFAKKIKSCEEKVGSSRPNVESQTTEGFVKAYVSGGANTVWCGVSSMIMEYSTPTRYFLSDESQWPIMNGILEHYGAKWRLSDYPNYDIIDFQPNPQGETQNQPLLTTQKAIDVKYEAIKILEDLIKDAAPPFKGMKEGKWEKSLEELKATNDNELCSDENKQKVALNLKDAEDNMTNYGWALTNLEPERCQNLIDKLKVYPEYCKS